MNFSSNRLIEQNSKKESIQVTEIPTVPVRLLVFSPRLNRTMGRSAGFISTHGKLHDRASPLELALKARVAFFFLFSPPLPPVNFRGYRETEGVESMREDRGGSVRVAKWFFCAFSPFLFALPTLLFNPHTLTLDPPTGPFPLPSSRVAHLFSSLLPVRAQRARHGTHY